MTAMYLPSGWTLMASIIWTGAGSTSIQGDGQHKYDAQKRAEQLPTHWRPFLVELCKEIWYSLLTGISMRSELVYRSDSHYIILSLHNGSTGQTYDLSDTLAIVINNYVYHCYTIQCSTCSHITFIDGKIAKGKLTSWCIYIIIVDCRF